MPVAIRPVAFGTLKLNHSQKGHHDLRARRAGFSWQIGKRRDDIKAGLSDYYQAVKKQLLDVLPMCQDRMCCHQRSVYGIQNPVAFSVVKLPVFGAADFQQFGANLASQRELTYGTLKLCQYICDNPARLNINTTQETRYGVDTVPYRQRVLKGHLLFHGNPLTLSALRLIRKFIQ